MQPEDSTTTECNPMFLTSLILFIIVLAFLFGIKLAVYEYIQKGSVSTMVAAGLIALALAVFLLLIPENPGRRSVQEPPKEELSILPKEGESFEIGGTRYTVVEIRFSAYWVMWRNSLGDLCRKDFGSNELALFIKDRK